RTASRWSSGGLGQLDGHVAVAELCLELKHELLYDRADHLDAEMAEGNDGIEAVAELRRELPVDRLVVVAFPLRAREAERLLGEIGGTRVRGHDQDHVAEVDLLAVVVGEPAVIHDLEE